MPSQHEPSSSSAPPKKKPDIQHGVVGFSKIKLASVVKRRNPAPSSNISIKKKQDVINSLTNEASLELATVPAAAALAPPEGQQTTSLMPGEKPSSSSLSLLGTYSSASSTDDSDN